MSNPFEILEKKLHNIECLLIEFKHPSVIHEVPKPVIMTGEEISAKFNVTIQTLIRWRHKGRIPYLQLGNSVRYDFNKVLAALEVSKKKGAQK